MTNPLFRLAPRMENVEASPTVRLNAMAQDMIRSGKDVINLTAGETDFETPDNIKKAAIAALSAGQTRYTAPHGTPELRRAVSEWMKRDFGLDYHVRQISVSAGVKQGLFNLILAIVGPGDEVIIPSPYWVSYPEMVRIAGGKPVVVAGTDDFNLDIDKIRAAINPKTRLVLLNSPNNPSGGMYERREMEALAKALEGTDILVASDEIYSSLVYDGREFVSFAKLGSDAFQRTITFNGLSKSHAMTGWRVGFAAGPEAVIEAMGILQAQSSTHVTTFVQSAAVEALKQSPEEFAPRLKEMQERRDLTVHQLRSIPQIQVTVPKGAFYVFPDLSYYANKLKGGSEAVAEYLLQDAGVAIVPGRPFGDDKKIRISFAKDLKTLENGLGRISRSLQKLLS